MKRKVLQHIIHSYLRDLKRNLLDTEPSYPLEPIHQFRVEYKQLRAFLRMICSAKQYKESVRLLKKIRKAYTILGRYRDLQLLELQITADVEPGNALPAGFIHALHKKQQKLQARFTKININRALNRTENSLFKSLPGRFTSVELSAYFKRKKQKIKRMILMKHIDDVEIHVIRKSLKDIFYNLKFLHEWELIPSGYQGMEVDFQVYEKLLFDLGRFQDKCTGINLIKRLQPKNWEATKLARLDLIQHKLIREKEDIKGIIRKEMEVLKTLIINNIIPAV